jgi:hypothetical protein
MREDLSFEPIEGGFSRRERVTHSYEVDLQVTVRRLPSGQIAISQQNVGHGFREATIPLTDEQARIIIAELTRALGTPFVEGSSS